MRITVDLLEEKKACKEHVEMFKEFLGDRNYVLWTKRNFELAENFGLDIYWFFGEFIEYFTRKMALWFPQWAYLYALNVDKCPSDDTRQACLSDPRWAYLYDRWRINL